SLFAQEFSPIDKSPMDAAFFPADAAKRAFKKGVSEPKVRVLYSRPSLKDRNLFRTTEDRKDGITQYGKPWRLGANESTELLLMQDALIGDTLVKAGRYSIVVTPTETEWTFHINSENDGWGNYSHKPELDVVTVSVPVKIVKDRVEQLSITMYSPNNDNTVHLKTGWGKYRTELPIVLK
ncbi:asparagine synthetase B, partial [Nonlabens dokdonensis]